LLRCGGPAGQGVPCHAYTASRRAVKIKGQKALHPAVFPEMVRRNFPGFAGNDIFGL